MSTQTEADRPWDRAAAMMAVRRLLDELNHPNLTEKIVDCLQQLPDSELTPEAVATTITAAGHEYIANWDERIAQIRAETSVLTGQVEQHEEFCRAIVDGWQRGVLVEPPVDTEQ